MSKKISSKSAKIISRLKGLLSVTETFNRANGALGFGAGTTSVPWKTVRGSWTIDTNKAASPSTPSDYALATLQFTNEDVQVGVNGIGPGVGVAFWVTDANNWWGAYLDSTQSCQTCSNTSNPASYAAVTTFVPASGGNCANYYVTCSSYTISGGPIAAYAFADYGGSPCSTPYNTFIGTDPGTCEFCFGYYGPCRCCRDLYYYYESSCSSYSRPCNNYNTYYPSFSYVTYNIATYNAVTYYSCNCVNNQSIKIVKNIAGTISQVASHAMAATVASFRAVLSGTNITIRGYSGANFTTQIGSDATTNAGSPVKTKIHGILKAPVTYAPTQTASIDDFTVA